MNISEIAKLANVSSAAVSRYFNNGYVSEGKKEAIRRVVEETGYQPSLQAQTLRTKKTKLIGVIAPKMASYSVGSVVDGIQHILEENGYQMLLAVTQNDAGKELTYLRTFNQKKVDGVILIATILDDEHRRLLSQMDIPVVINGQRMEGFPCVFYDDYHAVYDMTMHMLKRGRKRLGYIGVTEEDIAVGYQRHHGYIAALQDAGHPELSERIAQAAFSTESGEEKAEEMLERYPDLDGLICATDTIAAGAMNALRKRGCALPEQILVAGQGDSMLTRMAGSSACSIHYSYEESGQISAAMLLRLVRGEDNTRDEIRLGYYIVDPSEDEANGQDDLLQIAN